MSSKTSPKWKQRKNTRIRTVGTSDIARAGGGGISVPITVSQKQTRVSRVDHGNILFPDGYTYGSIKRIQVPPSIRKPLQEVSTTGQKQNDYVIRFQRSLENYMTFDGKGFGSVSSRSQWFWPIDSSNWSPIPSLSTQTKKKQGQENMEELKEFLKRRGEFLIYATKWSDPIHYPHIYHYITYSSGNTLFEFLAGVRIGITNFGNLIVNSKNGTYQTEEETRSNRNIEIYEIRQTPFSTDAEENQLANILVNVIIPFLDWTSQIKPVYRGGIVNFNWFYSMIRCPFETILPLLISFLMCPKTISLDGEKPRRQLPPSLLQPESSQSLLKQIEVYLRQNDLQKKVIQRETKLLQREETLAQKQRGLDQREQIFRKTQEQFRKRKKHKVLTDTELAELLSSYPILNQERVKNRLLRAPSGRVADTSLFRLFWTREEDPDLYLFHGTDSSSRKRIQDQGIRTDVATNVVYGQGFYLTTNPEEALGYAESRFRERRRTRRCMSPILLVFKIHKDKAKTWILGQDFNLKETPPYYIVCKNQEKLEDLEMVEMIFLEERCF